MHWIALIFGIIILAEGLLFAISPKGGKRLAKTMLDWSDKFYRILGISI